MVRSGWKSGVMAGAVASVLACSGLVTAQPTNLPESMTKASIDVPTIVGQLRLAKRFGQTALDGLEAMPLDDMIVTDQSLDARTVRMTRDTYVMIRAAKESIEARQYRVKTPDPMLELAYKKVMEAWNLARTAPGNLSSSLPRSSYLPIAIRDTKRALQLVDQALTLLS